MKRLIGIALLAALAVEAINFWFLIPPIDVGYAPGTPWYVSLIGFQWSILHFPGLYLLDSLERVSGCRQPDIVMACRQVDTWVLFVSGYLSTALLAVAAVLGFRWISQSARKNSNA